MEKLRCQHRDRLVQLIYGSTATKTFSDEEFDAFLEDAWIYNQEHDISSRLVHHGDTFTHVLEGPAHEVAWLFKMIKKDHRHKNVRIELYRYISAREFGEHPIEFVDSAESSEDASPSSEYLETLTGSVQTMNETTEEGALSWQQGALAWPR